MPKKGSKSAAVDAGKAPAGGTPAQKDVRNPDRIRTSLADDKRAQQLRKESLSVFNPHVDGAVAGRRDLSAVDLVEEQPGFIVVIEELFSPDECRQLAAAIDAVGLNPPNGADLNPRKNEAFLCRHSLSFTDPHLENVVWQRMRPHFPPVDDCRAVGFDGSLRYYKYLKGDQFGQHVDVSTKGGPGEETEYTLLIYLNGGESEAELAGAGEDALQGGETIFWKTKTKQLASVAPQRGAALLHAHGRRCLMHEGSEVTKGCKYMLRSDVMYRRMPEEAERRSYDAESRALAMEADPALSHWRPKELAAVIAPAAGIDAAGKKPKDIVEEAIKKLELAVGGIQDEAAAAVGGFGNGGGSGGGAQSARVRKAALRVVAALDLELRVEEEPAAAQGGEEEEESAGT
jgi:hypothetical protein